MAKRQGRRAAYYVDRFGRKRESQRCTPNKNSAHLFQNRTASEQFVNAKRRMQNAGAKHIMHRISPPSTNKYYINPYALFPFGDPVRAGHAGVIPAGITFLWTVLACTGFGKSISAGVNSRGTKNHGWMANGMNGNGKSRFPREPFGWERAIKTSSGIVWVGPRERE